MAVPFLHKRGDHYYIQEHDPTDNKKIRTLQPLGIISDDAARQMLDLWKKSIEIKPVYRTIVIDPPWPIEKSLRTARPNQMEMDYKTWSLEEIRKFPIKKFISKDGCHLYLWTTHKYLPDAIQILGDWGFKYHCLLTWVKNVGFTPFSFMFSTELVLFGLMGNVAMIKKGERLDFTADAREHSRKPDTFYDLVKRVSPDPRIDIFSREKRDGFDQWGIEVGKFNG